MGVTDAETVWPSAQDSVNPPWPSAVCVTVWIVSLWRSVAARLSQQLATAVPHDAVLVVEALVARQARGVLAHAPLLVEGGEVDHHPGADRLRDGRPGEAVPGDVGEFGCHDGVH